MCFLTLFLPLPDLGFKGVFALGFPPRSYRDAPVFFEEVSCSAVRGPHGKEVWQPADSDPWPQ